MNRPSIPEIIDRFAIYYQKPGNQAWGKLHVILDDGNVTDSTVEWCIEYANLCQDFEAVALAQILLSMTKTQRLKLPHKVKEHLHARPD